MTSYISAFKALLCALAVILAVEGAFFVSTPPPPTHMNNLYEMRYLGNEVWQKYLIENKIRYLSVKPAEFIQVGDSSGFFGVQPLVIMQHLKGMTYLDASCCGDTGFPGYRYIAEAFLQKDPARKYLVLHMSPYALPMRKMTNQAFYPILYDNLISSARFINYIPSIKYRREVTNTVYYWNPNFSFLSFSKENAHDKHNIELAIDVSKDNLGYMPLPNWGDGPSTGACAFEGLFDEDGKPTLKNELEEFKKLADKYQVKLIVIFNHVACDNNPSVKPIQDEVDAFHAAHPDVYIPFDLITTWDKSNFADNFHLHPFASVPHSHEIGVALRKILDNEKKPENRSKQ